MTALENLQKKVDSKSWTDAPLTKEDIEIIEDALYGASVLVAQVRSWNELHQHVTEIFKQIVETFNTTIVFGEEPSVEETQQNG